MNFFVKPTVKNIVLVILCLFYGFIIFSNILANREGMESEDSKDSELDKVNERKKTSTKLEESEDANASVEDDSY